MEKAIIKDKEIKSLVYVIRGQQVMLDSDLAELYGYTAKRLNEQVIRNIERFPDNFMFKLTKDEIPIALKSQFATLNKAGNNRGQHLKKMPNAFTEKGISMLATVLRSKIAVEMNIAIIEYFTMARHYFAENSQLLNNQDMLKISNRLAKHEEDITDIKANMATKTDISKIMDNFIDEADVKEITILNGQKFEAIEAYTKIYKQAFHNIFIIDDYINIDTLKPLKCKKENVNVILFSDNKGTGRHKLRQHEIDTFDVQYPSLALKRNGIAHDRYIVIDYFTDNEKIYHCGTSSKDAGKKVCGINEMNDSGVLHEMIDKLLADLS